MLVVIVQAQSKELFDTVFCRLVGGVQQFHRQVVQVLIFQTGVARQCVFDIRREKIVGLNASSSMILYFGRSAGRNSFRIPIFLAIRSLSVFIQNHLAFL